MNELGEQKMWWDAFVGLHMERHGTMVASYEA